MAPLSRLWKGKTTRRFIDLRTSRCRAQEMHSYFLVSKLRWSILLSGPLNSMRWCGASFQAYWTQAKPPCSLSFSRVCRECAARFLGLACIVYLCSKSLLLGVCECVCRNYHWNEWCTDPLWKLWFLEWMGPIRALWSGLGSLNALLGGVPGVFVVHKSL